MRVIMTAAGLVAGLALIAAATQASAASPAPEQPDAQPAPVADADLAEMSGGQDTTIPNIYGVLTSQTETATNTNNMVAAGNNVSSGDVNLGQDAFQGFAGIGNFVVNTGHNNNLLGSLSVAINMAPAGTQ
jgi:hypothetical protein